MSAASQAPTPGEPIFRHLLVPLDGSRLAEASLPVALALAARLGAGVTLLHVLERHAPKEVHGEAHLADEPAAVHYLAEVATRHAHPAVQIDPHVHTNKEDDVAGSIVAHAEELGADLVVLTPHGQGTLRRLVIGSIPQLVLKAGVTPVLFVPPAMKGPAAGVAGTTGAGARAEARFEVRNLLVPLGGHNAGEVLRIARELQAAFGARLRLLHVVPTLETMGDEGGAIGLFSPRSTTAVLELEEESAREEMAELVGGWPEEAKPTCTVLRGEPAQVILEVIAKTRPDLTLMSTHARSGLTSVWSASVAARVVARSPRPLLLAPWAGEL